MSIAASGRARLRVGLLGGSFNPAHGGHRHISELALKALRLDQLWWLVSPQNPLKSTAGMAPLAERLALARALARHPRMRVTDIEARLGTSRTADTLSWLKRRFPAISFVWIIGADNLAQIHRWDRWRDIFAAVPIAVFDRPTYSRAALRAKAARYYWWRRLPFGRAAGLALRPAPAWIFIRAPLHSASATAIRRHQANAKLARRISKLRSFTTGSVKS